MTSHQLTEPRALTLIQPWATLIVRGHKHYETRSWRTSYRGQVYIHAGAKIDWQSVEFYHEHGLLGRSLPRRGDLPTKAVVAVADLAGCYPTPVAWITWADDGSSVEYSCGDYSPGRWAWEFQNIRVLDEPVECRGNMGLWTPLPETVEAVNRQLEVGHVA